MRIQSLGGLALEGSSLRRPKPLTLLAYLALEGRQDRRFLAELFWPRAADARKSLTVALARLRAAAPASIDADRTHVRTVAQIDVHEVLEALEEGRLDHALTVYRGPFLHGAVLPGAGPELEEWVYQTREFVAERVMLTLIDVAEREASRGEERRSLARAEAAYGMGDPVRLAVRDLARLHALLTRGGSPLARRLRAEADELGVPLDEVPTAPAPPLAARSATVPHIPRLRPWRGADSFVGRSVELEAAAALLRTGEDRLLCITGPPGVGKTRLALGIVRRLAGERDDDGVHFVPLAGTDQPELLGAIVADALGLGTSPVPEGWSRVVGAIDAGRDVLLLDNFEQLVGAAPQLVELLAACPNLRVVVTTRVRLDLTVERVLPLEGLPFPNHPAVGPEEVASSDAARLFVERARRHRPALPLDEPALGGILAICRSTGGLPLALELAAAWARVLPIGEIAADLERDLDLLETDAADRPERHRGMRSAIERSWRLLRSHDRAALTRLVVFAGDFDRRAAAAVAGVSLPRLAALLDTSLLRWDGSKRYGMHPLIRRFVRERAHEVPELVRDAAERHATYFLGRLAEHPDAFRRGQAPAASGDLLHDLDDTVAAWRWAAGAHRRDLLAAAAEPFGWLLYMRGRPRLGLELMTAAEPYLPSGPQARFRAMYLAADGRTLEAVALMEQTLDAAPTATPLERAHQLRVLGVARLGIPEPDVAASERDFREALEHYERAADDEGASMMLNNLAGVARDPLVGLALVRAAERRAAHGGEHHARGVALGTRTALHLWFTGTYRAAAAAADEAARLHEHTGFDALVPAAILLRAEAHLALGRLGSVERDIAALVQAAERAHRGRAAAWRAAGLALLARSARLTGDRAAAAAAARACLAADDAVGSHAQWFAHLLLAMLALEDGRLDDTEAALVRLDGMTHGSRAEEPGVPGIVLATARACAEAALEAARGRTDESASRLRAALDAAQRARSRPSCLSVVGAFATLRLQQARATETARLRQLVATHPAAHAETRAMVVHGRPAPVATLTAPASRRRDDAPPPTDLDEVVRELLQAAASSRT